MSRAPPTEKTEGEWVIVSGKVEEEMTSKRVFVLYLRHLPRCVSLPRSHLTNLLTNEAQ